MNSYTHSSKFTVEVSLKNDNVTATPFDTASATGDAEPLDPEKDLEIRVMDTKYIGTGLGKDDKGRPANPEVKRELHNSLSFHALAAGSSVSPYLQKVCVKIKRIGDIEDINSVNRQPPNPYSKLVQIGVDDLPIAGTNGGNAFTGNLSPDKELGQESVTEFPEKYADYD